MASTIIPIPHNNNDLMITCNDTCNSLNGTYSNTTLLQRDGLYVVIPLTIIYAMIFLTGIIGNVSTCIVIARNKAMHTATNYYLFSLAISDLLLLISGLPVEMYEVWYRYQYIFGEGFCIARGLAAETSTNASVLTIASFTVERYVAICHPFLSQTLSKLSRAIRLILIIWLVALSFAVPQALQFGLVEYKNSNLISCTMKRNIISHSFELSTFLFFVMPMCLITVLYVLIGLKLRNSNRMKKTPGRNETVRNCRRYPGRSSRRVLKMLVAVVIAFFICWAPFHVQRLVAIYGTSDDHISSKTPMAQILYNLTTYVSGVFYYVSTTINPILYNIMSNKFRIAFMETLSRSCRLSVLPVHNEQRSYSSFSRSQRTNGAYGSRPMCIGGSGVIPDNIEYSGSSGREETQMRNLENQNQTNNLDNILKSTDISDIRRKSVRIEYNKETRNNNGIATTHNTKNSRHSNNHKSHESNRERRIIRENQYTSWSKTSKYKTVRVSNIDDSGKKWWRFLKWLPGLKALKLPRRNTHVPEGRIFDEFSSHPEELSMTTWNIHEGNDQLPV